MKKRLSALILDGSEILAKFHVYVKAQATVDARGYVIFCLWHGISREILPKRVDCIYKRGLLRCRPT